MKKPIPPIKWDIIYTEHANRSFKKLDRPAYVKIRHFIDETLRREPYPRRLGYALSGMRGVWRYRVGEYRLICEIHDDKLTIVAIHVGHRQNVYKKLHLVKS